MRNKIKQVFKIQTRLLLFVLLLCGNISAVAAALYSAQASENTTPSALTVAEQRELFLLTEEQINARRFSLARQNMSQLQDYALYPYLEAAFLQQNLSLANEALIGDFLVEYADTPVAEKLRTAWLEFLAEQNKAEVFLNYYQGSGNAQLQCRYLDYLWQHTDNLSALWPQVSNQWISERSQPAACDRVFNAWVEAGMRTEEAVWQRLMLAVKAKQYSLAGYLTRLLPEEHRYLAVLSRRVQANPAAILRFNDFTNTHPREQEIVTSALHRLIWRDVSNAKRAWAHFQNVYSFSSSETHDMHERIGITLSVRGEAGALAWLEKVPVQQLSATGQQWLLASLLRQQRYDRIAMLINALAKEEQEKDQWQYWRGRALIELGFVADGEQELQEVAQSRSYYGFLASARLGLAPSLRQEEVHYETAALEQLRHKPSMQRAMELYALDRTLAARREWNVIGYRGSYEEQVLSAIFAHENGRYEEAIFGLARTGLFNDVERRFPLAFKELLSTHAENQGLDPAWVFAIVRRESAFRTDAISPAGARGLMQVMPETANYLVRRTPGPNQGRISKSRLLNPEENVQLGTRYMSELLQRTGNNWIIATAAYNAGLNRVVEWLPEQPTDFDIWVETMPYQETRDYVKNVLAYQQIYTILMGKKDHVLAPLISLQMYAEHRG
ncbi:transglycosylase SLT domain-containing protein [Aliidiomarina quisquiliarum]|uniref:transglycosylase SLT domain-containing protein n=1 Tax=Aliidiomarina quisquiliarum TaxID=2938947 RepID=UPI00208E9775|nr:transglycosylase SLT domain-containing protein [Aliidiomarina quisquiliarum]MCO4321294.1 transglycosylase SLT domain-containing protein [Aliidiomarina quisquiliarum]